MKDYFNYKGKVCVVTGAASGMGEAAAEMLVDLGAKVYALDYAEVKTEGVEKSIQVNLGEKDQIDQAFESTIPKEIDSFFGVAGVSGEHHDFDTTMTINYIANKYITETYLKERMKENGAIAFVTSLGGLYWEKYTEETQVLIDASGWDNTLKAVKELNVPSRTGNFAYAVSKRVLNHFAASQVDDFMERKVRVNYIMPAPTETGLIGDFAQMAGGMDNLIAGTGVANRIATAKEMAEPLVFLNSDMASYMSGVGLIIDSGNTVQEALGKKQPVVDFNFFQQNVIN